MSYLFPAHLSQHAENKHKSRKRWFWLAWEHRWILVKQFKIIQNYKRNDNSNKVQIEQSRVILQTTFRAKELETKGTTRKQENLKNDHGIVRFRLNIG